MKELILYPNEEEKINIEFDIVYPEKKLLTSKSENTDIVYFALIHQLLEIFRILFHLFPDLPRLFFQCLFILYTLKAAD